MLKDWNEKWQIALPGDKQQTLNYATEHLLKCYKEAIADHDAFHIALSGGSTPKALFEMLTSTPYRDQIDWTKVHLFWSDERSVPPTNPDSNYHMAMEAGLKQMPIPPNQIHRMVAEKDVETNAEKYEEILKPFDLIMLGMGEDGHTASLFPGTIGLTIKDRLVIANRVPQKDTVRMSMTFKCINQARHIAIYILGAGKQQILREVLTTKDTYPIQQVGSKQAPAHVIIDEDAAKLIQPLFNS